MPSSNSQQVTARAEKQAQNQANRARARQPKTVVASAERQLTHYEKVIREEITVILDKALAERGDDSSDNQARDTKYWMGWSREQHPNWGLQAFAAAEAARWYEKRHPRKPREVGKKFDRK